MNRKKSILFYINFACLMVGLGASDAARGVFAPVFQGTYHVTAEEISMLVTMSYTGNLLFMLLGGNLADRFGEKKIFSLSILLWGLSLFTYIFTDSYMYIVIAVLFAMGASTLLNMLMNIMSPSVFNSPGMVINTLFFIQGIGTTFTQSFVGARADSIGVWKLFNSVLLIIAICSLMIFLFISDRSEEKADSLEDNAEKNNYKKTDAESAKNDGFSSEKSSSNVYRKLVSMPAFYLFTAIFGFYFMAEHGVMNWMNLYCRESLMMSAGESALIPSLFFGGITAGRLLLSPLVAKMKLDKSLLFALSVSSLFYLPAVFLGGKALYLLLPSGLFVSIVYPTMVMLIRQFFPEDMTSTASGTIMAAATVFDIMFNAVFGKIILALGYASGIRILPVSMLICVIFYLVLLAKKHSFQSELS